MRPTNRRPLHDRAGKIVPPAVLRLREVPPPPLRWGDVQDAQRGSALQWMLRGAYSSAVREVSTADYRDGYHRDGEDLASGVSYVHYLSTAVE